MVWQSAQLRPHVLRSLQLVTPEQAGRRVVYLANPGRSDVTAVVGWLYSGLQVMAPGECRSEEHTSELQSLMRISYAVFCLKKKNNTTPKTEDNTRDLQHVVRLDK